MTITKSNIIDQIYTNTALSKAKSIQATETTLEIIKRTLAAGESVMISGFGKFEVKEKAERKGRNPATGGDLMLDAQAEVEPGTSK